MLSLPVQQQGIMCFKMMCIACYFITSSVLCSLSGASSAHSEVTDPKLKAELDFQT